MKFYQLLLTGFALTSAVMPPDSQALEVGQMFNLDGWNVACTGLGTKLANCRTNRFEKPPFVYLDVRAKTVTIQIRQDCSFDGKAPPVVIHRKTNANDELWLKLTGELERAVRECPSGAVPDGWDQSTLEMIEILYTLTRP